ncbi:MAG TPA: acetyl-CoA hydrolase/transferase C-terminal domain-containing protein, partial [Pseudonocardia sp.]
DLAEAGALAEPRDGPTVVSGSAMGTDRLYRYLDRNPAVSLRPVERVHNGQVLAAIPRLVAVNSALQVDLSGQVNAEGIGSRTMGAIGGQVDFLRGAVASPGGVGVIALQATASRGSTSRVVRTLDGPVTTGRADVQWVVTEYGAADLRGLAPAERARALIEIAAPQFRAELAGN